MKHPILMPVLSDTMATGRLTQWVKSIGAKVSKGDAVAEVETDKAVLEVEAFSDGYLAGPLAPVDQDIPVKQVIGYLADTAEEAASAGQTAPADPAPASEAPPVSPPPKPSLPAEPFPTPPVAAEPSPAAPAEPVPVPQAFPGGPSEGHAASPYARALAFDLGIDMAQVVPGPDGKVQAPEIVAALLAPAQPPLNYGPPYRLEAPTKSREAVARTMMAASATPSFRVTARLPIRELQHQAASRQVSLTVALSKACAFTIQAYPRFNAVWTNGGLALRDRIDVGIAVEAQDSLITPVLRDAGGKSLADLQSAWKDLLSQTKSARLGPKDYSGATFYLSNLGVYPVVRQFDAVVPLGASAILAVAAMDSDGSAECTLTCDHRVVFGADAAHFLTHLASQLATPDSLW